ncbi:hypothetical protein QYF36_010672 [Acer negundo]|nr:hypothetical protein QYF36_010672 [Acer negundo]
MVESWISEIKHIHRRRLGRLIVGLDIEHHPNFNYKNEHPVATLQLCDGHRGLIFQMIHAPDIPQCLEDFLLNEKYSFVGVKVDEDAEKLENDYNLSVGNAIDLRTLAAEHVELLGMNMKELKQAGLKGLSERILGKKLEKPKNIQLSNWDDRKLSSDQVQHACLDAFVSFEIARTLKKNPASFISSSQPSYSFVGVKVEENVKRLERDNNLSVGNAIELKTLAAQGQGMNMEESKKSGLEGLSEKVLGKKVEKPKEIELSSWENCRLRPDQVQYACVDAFVSFKIGGAFKSGSVRSSSSSPPGFCHRFVESLLALFFSFLLFVCLEVVCHSLLKNR